MAKRKLELFLEVNTEKELANVLNHNRDKLICAETYSSHFGSCTALDRLLWLFKFEWSSDEVILLKVLIDHIAALERLSGQSEPFYMFIVNHRVTKVFRGVDCMRFAEVAKTELQYYRMGDGDLRQTFALDEATPDELERINKRAEENEKHRSSVVSRRAARQAARKRHRAMRMAPYLSNLNFVLFWPHAKHAHPELYERWDMNNIIMVGREEIELTSEQAHDVLYAGDAPLNEASIHALTSAPALAICFRILDEDKHFVSLVRKILYEEILVSPTEERRNSRELRPHVTAYNYYKSFSPTREQMRQKRREERIKRKQEEKEKKKRHIAEKKRLALQAKEEDREAKKKAKEQLKLDLLKSGNIFELNKLKAEPDEDDIEDQEDIEMETEEVEEEACEEEDYNEYLPPAGLEVPGLYSPPNDIAKANGLAILFPKLVLEKVTPLSEFLPPHVLVMLHIQKRHKAVKIIALRKAHLIHMGIFKAETPYKPCHVAYSVKQFDAMNLPVNVTEDLKLCLMVSIKVDTLLLELMDLSPQHVSRDPMAGEDECSAMFRVDYGDDYQEFEDFDNDSNE